MTESDGGRQWHDALVRGVLGEPEQARSELHSVLPPRLLQRLDLSRLTLQPGSFVTPELRQRHTDLLFRTTFDQRDAYVYVLIEHQRTPDPLMAYRMAGYQSRIWDRYLSDPPHGSAPHELPLIVPVVIYQGRDRWNAPTDLGGLLDIDDDTADALGGLLPRMRYLLDDLTALDDDALRARPLTPAARLAFAALRNGPGSADVTVWLGDWRDDIAALSDRILALIVTYLWWVSETPPESLRKFATTVGHHTEEVIMTTAEQLRAEGRVEGRVEGKAEGKAELLLSQLTIRFGPLDGDHRNTVESATPEQIDLWSTRLIQGPPTLTGIFA